MKCWEINTPTGPITASFEILEKMIGDFNSIDESNIGDTVFVRGDSNMFSISKSDWLDFQSEVRDRKISKIVD